MSNTITFSKSVIQRSKIYSRKLRNFASRFKNDDKGTVAITAAVSIIPIMLCAGIAVDYTRIAHTRGLVDDALDAAVLMAGQSLSEGQNVNAQFQEEFEDFFHANINGRTKLLNDVNIVSFNADPTTGEISAVAQSSIDMTFMRIMGKDSINIRSEAGAIFSSKKVELAMMLDVTGSMGREGKLAALKIAATDAVNILLPTTSTNNKMRIALVPYSSSVNVGNLSRLVSTNRRNQCVTERSRNRFTDASYRTSKVKGRDANCPDQEVVPLTANPAPLKTTIRSLSANGRTAGHLGVSWGYYTLSPNWSAAWDGEATPGNYADTKVKKIALLMTDGKFNTVYTGGGDSASFAISTCADMKRQGIDIYTVAFKAPIAAQSTLRSCASEEGAGNKYYFSADNANELKMAFRTIAQDIRRLRLTR